MDHYIIVGRKIDDGGTRYLHSDGEINDDPQKSGIAGEALNVEFIGRTVVALSQKPRLAKGSAEYLRITEQIRNALVVIGPDNYAITADEQQAILDNLTVELEYDTRIPGAGSAPDTNIRKLVIPSQGSFDYRENHFKGEAPNPGFEPPLTYTLDRMMMQQHFARQIKSVLEDYRDKDNTPLPDGLRKELETAVDQKLGSYKAFVDTVEDETGAAMANVLTSPLSAFYRAIGIYTTNMCD